MSGAWKTPRSQSRHRGGLLPSCLPFPPLIERPVTDLSLSLPPSFLAVAGGEKGQKRRKEGSERELEKFGRRCSDL